MDVCDVVIAGGDRGPKRGREVIYRRRDGGEEEKRDENVCVWFIRYVKTKNTVDHW